MIDSSSRILTKQNSRILFSIRECMTNVNPPYSQNSIFPAEFREDSQELCNLSRILYIYLSLENRVLVRILYSFYAEFLRILSEFCCKYRILNRILFLWTQNSSEFLRILSEIFLLKGQNCSYSQVKSKILEFCLVRTLPALFTCRSRNFSELARSNCDAREAATKF